MFKIKLLINYFYFRLKMAWGIFNKIKRGFKKVGSAFKKGIQFVNDKIVKPFKPVITNVANAIIPGSGKIVEAVSDGIDGWSSSTQGSTSTDVANGNFKGATQRMVGMPNPNARPYRKLNM
jgi:hypothetical protein